MKSRILSLFVACAVALLVLSASAQETPKVGIQTWTLRNMNFDQMVKFASEQKLKYVQLIPNHVNVNMSTEELTKKKAILEQAGLVPYTFGVAGTSLDKEENRKLFEFVKFMGMKMVVVEPGDFRILDHLEALAKEFDIKVAIHNHGIKSHYGNPLIVKTLIDHRDPRMGVCLDVGHVTGAGFDAAKVFRDYNGRVFDIHLKDKVVEKTQGDDVIRDVEIGTGQTNFKGLFAELKKSKWDGVLAIETDNGSYAGNPKEYVTKAQAFVTQNFPK